MSENDMETLQEVLNAKALQHGRKIAMGCILSQEECTGYSGDIMLWVRDTLERLGFSMDVPDEEQDPLLLAGIDYDEIQLSIIRGTECVMSAERRRQRRLQRKVPG
jgi:hypothetical protein